MNDQRHRSPTLTERVSALETRCQGIELHLDQIANRLHELRETLQVVFGSLPRPEPGPQPQAGTDIPPNPLVAGRWFQRDGNIFKRYTYESKAALPAQMRLYEWWVRRSPPATE